MPEKEINFYHARPLAFAHAGEVGQVPDLEDPHLEHYEAAFQWLRQQLGFYGVFLAVGAEKHDTLIMTGYDRQFSRSYTQAAPPNQCNRVLFRYNDLTNVRFSDHDNWHIILNRVQYPPESDGTHKMEDVSDTITRQVLKPSWKKSDWLRAALREQIHVQAHVESLNLAAADVIWCRNQTSKKELVRKGFDETKITVKRLKVAEDA